MILVLAHVTLTPSWTHATIVAALFAATMNFVAAWYLRRRPSEMTKLWATMFLWTGTYAVFYCGAYLWLDLISTDRARWSRTMTPFSLLTFLTIWVNPAIMAVANARVVRKTTDILAQGMTPGQESQGSEESP